ncbi:MAG: hypothetical protein ACHQQQ_13365 [Bacteroidota bacterium]
MKKKYIFIFLTIIIFILMGFGIYGYLKIKSLYPPVERGRITSPDSLLDAVLLEFPTSALDPYFYKLYIVPRGDTSFDTGSSVFGGEAFEDLKVDWKIPRLIEIHYEYGRIEQFTNYTYFNKFTPPIEVELRLVPSQFHTSLPRSTYHPDFITVSSSAGPNGTISPSPSVIITYGDSATFTFTPAKGYHVDSLYVDGVGAQAKVFGQRILKHQDKRGVEILSFTVASVSVIEKIHVTFIHN